MPQQISGVSLRVGAYTSIKAGWLGFALCLFICCCRYYLQYPGFVDMVYGYMVCLLLSIRYLSIYLFMHWDRFVSYTDEWTVGMLGMNESILVFLFDLYIYFYYYSCRLDCVSRL